MSSRRKPVDYVAVKKSRAALIGHVTKAMDKFTAIPHNTPEEVRGINSKDVDRHLGSLTRTETTFQLTLAEAQDFCPTEEEDEAAFQEGEDSYGEQFFTSVTKARDLGDTLLNLKSVLNGLADFKTGLSALQESLEEKPDTNQQDSLQALNLLYTDLRKEWNRSNLEHTHPIRGELHSCWKILTCLGADVATAKDKSDSHSSITSTSSHSTH